MRTLFFSSTREVLFVVDADDLVHLLRQRAAFDGAGLAADIGDAQLPAELDAS